MIALTCTRLAAEGVGQRHSEESQSTRRDSSDGGERGLMPEIRTAVRTGDTLMTARRTEAAAARSGDHAGIALHSADRGKSRPFCVMSKPSSSMKSAPSPTTSAARPGAFAGAPGGADVSSAGTRRTFGTQKPIEEVAHFLTGNRPASWMSGTGSLISRWKCPARPWDQSPPTNVGQRSTTGW